MIALCNSCRVHEKLSDNDLAAALLRASRVLVGVAARSIATADEVVTIAQFRALVVLDAHGPSNLTGLSARLGVTSSTALRMVERLVRAGLVTRTPHPASRREVLVALTTHGRQLVDRVTQRRRAELATIARRMPTQARVHFVEALEAFSIAADEPTVSQHEESLWAWGHEAGST